MTENSSIIISLPGVDSWRGGNASWEFYPHAPFDSGLSQQEFAEEVARLFAEGKFTVEIVHRSTTTEKLR